MKSGEKKMTCWNKKLLLKKIYTVLKMIKKKKKFLQKILVGIKDDRDNMTRQENLQKKIWTRIR